MNNRLGIHYGSFVTNWDEEQKHLIAKVKELGYDALEFGAIWLSEQSDAKIAELRSIAEDQDVQLVMSLGMPPSHDISSPDEATRNAGITVLKNIAAAMAKVGAKTCSGIVHGAWNGKIKSYDEKPERWDISVRSMKEACRTFAQEGVVFNVEVVNRFENFLVNTCLEAMDYLDAVDSPQLGIHLDTFHMNIEEDSMVEAIIRAGSRLKHFHIGENNRKFPGLGAMPWKTIFAALEAADYRGPIVMEPFVRPGGEVGSDVSLYRPLMDLSHYEDDIRQSVRFTRSLMA